MAFLETPVFPGTPDYGYTVFPLYSTSITRRASGKERRNRNWSRPLHRYECTLGEKDADAIETIRDFYHAVGGQEYGFRFKDWSDFKSCGVTGTAAETDQPIGAVTPSTSPLTYQLIKEYVAGAASTLRYIQKPVEGTILIADAGVLKTETTHYVIDYATGLVTFTYTPVGALTWGGEFDVPVRFGDNFPITIDFYNISSLNFSLEELRDAND